MIKITIYQKPSCTTCKQVFAILKEKNVNLDRIDYFIKPLSKEKIRMLIKKMGITSQDLLRKKEETYKSLLREKEYRTEDEWVELMAQHPELIQRPIVEKGNAAVLARPAENIYRIL